MTFRCLCVQRVLKVGIISGNFSLFFSRGYFSNNLEKSTAEPNRYRQSQFAGLTRLQLDEVGRERQVQQQGRQRAEALAERSVEIA